MRRRPTNAALVLLVVASGPLCCGAETPSILPVESRNFPLILPPGFPEPKLPAHNPPTPEKIELGRYLFYDKLLSTNRTQSCSSCHKQSLAFADGRTVPLGSTGQILARNSPGLSNTAYNASLTWANPQLLDLESQILVPLLGESPVELGLAGNEQLVLGRIAEVARYREQFAAAFPTETNPVSLDSVVQAVASFVRSLISGNSPFDRFTYQGMNDALSSSAQRGLELFFSERLECHHCHGGFNFSQSTVTATSVFGAVRFQNTGLYNLDAEGAYPPNNTGLFDLTGNPQDMGKFRAPSLRNVELTAPYMHDGSVETLEDVVRIYEAGGRNLSNGPYAGDGRANPLKDGLLIGFSLSDPERDDLVEFLRSLTDQDFLNAEPFSNPFQEVGN